MVGSLIGQNLDETFKKRLGLEMGLEEEARSLCPSQQWTLAEEA